MSSFFQNIYNGLLRFKPLGKNLKFATQKGSFPKLNYLDQARKTELEKLLGIHISHVEFFEQALTHRSYLQVKGDSNFQSNERLEFLGDAVLNLVVADYLFSLHANVMEGELTKMRSWLVNKTALAIFAKKIHLENFILLSFSATKSLEKGSDSILADCLEAVIGAIYLDSGHVSAMKFITNSIIPVVMNQTDMVDKNFKSIYLEYVQSIGLPSPSYRVLEESGPDHEKTFIVGVYVDNELKGIGEGRSKKLAEQVAAEMALKKNNNDDDENNKIENEYID